MFKLHGILPPIATPFDHRGELYKVKVQHNVEKWNRTGLTGYVVCGSTGESVYLTTEEKLQMWEWVAEYADSGKILVCGSGMESVRSLGRIFIDLLLNGGLGYEDQLRLYPISNVDRRIRPPVRPA